MLEGLVFTCEMGILILTLQRWLLVTNNTSEHLQYCEDLMDETNLTPAIRLPDFINKNAVYPSKSEFQINNQIF